MTSFIFYFNPTHLIPTHSNSITTIVCTEFSNRKLRDYISYFNLTLLPSPYQSKQIILSIFIIVLNFLIQNLAQSTFSAFTDSSNPSSVSCRPRVQSLLTARKKIMTTSTRRSGTTRRFEKPAIKDQILSAKMLSYNILSLLIPSLPIPTLDKSYRLLAAVDRLLILFTFLLYVSD